MSDQTGDPGRITDVDPGEGAAVGKKVIEGFVRFHEQQEKTKWSWIAVAVALGNFFNTGPVLGKNHPRWTQSEVAAKVLTNPNSNVAGAPEKSMNVTFVYSGREAANTAVNQDFGAMRGAINAGTPVVLGWGVAQRDIILDGTYIVVYGYNGPSNWYFGDPLKPVVTENAALPIPQNPNLTVKVVYPRNPALRMS